MSKRYLALTLLLSSWLLGLALAQSVPTLKVNLWYVLDGLELEIHDHQLAVDLHGFAHFLRSDYDCSPRQPGSDCPVPYFYDPDTKQASIYWQGQIIRFTLAKSQASLIDLQGSSVTLLPSAPYLSGGKFMVPLEALVKSLGIEYSWEKENNLFWITGDSLNEDPAFAYSWLRPNQEGQLPSGEIKLKVGEYYVVYLHPSGPELRQGQLFVPLYSFSQFLVTEANQLRPGIYSSPLSYDPASKSALIHWQGRTVRFTLGQKQASLFSPQGSSVIKLPLAPYISSGSMMVPLAQLAQGLGLEYSWQEDEKLFWLRGAEPFMEVARQTAEFGTYPHQLADIFPVHYSFSKTPGEPTDLTVIWEDRTRDGVPLDQGAIYFHSVNLNWGSSPGYYRCGLVTPSGEFTATCQKQGRRFICNYSPNWYSALLLLSAGVCSPSEPVQGD